MLYKKTTLKNGVRVLTSPMPGNPTVTTMVMVGTGSHYEKREEAGLSHFLEHMCFKGTAKRPTAFSITAELDGIGASYNAFTGEEFTGYYAKADSRHFERIGDIVVDIFKNSTFPEGEIVKEKGVVKGEIDMYADDPQQKVVDALRAHMYKGETAEMHILGTKETVDAVTRGDLIAYRDSQYKAGNTVIAIAGGVSEEAMLAFAEKAFADMEAGESRKEIPTKDRAQQYPELLVVDKDTDQAHLMLAWRTFRKDDPRRFAASVVRGILRGGLSSRLFVKLRDEMGSGYYVGADSDLHQSFGNFSISTGTTSERVSEIAEAILNEAKKLVSEPVPAAELDKVRELMIARLRMSLETSDGIAEYLAFQEIFEDKIRLPEEYEELFKGIGQKEIASVAKDIFDPSKLTVAVVGKGIDRQKLAGTVGA